MIKESNRYYGKYRGTVINNIDPEQRGRIMAIAPDVQGLIPLSWALPCVPIASKLGGTFMVPQIGAGVWMEFEQGDPDYPIWVGGFWGIAAELPLAALAGNPLAPSIVLQSTLQQAVIISDMAPTVPPPVMPPLPTTGGIILRSATGASIVVNDLGIFINNGKGASIEMIGPSVMINKVALVVT
ncbi:MAG: baseplate assembly protein [Anaerolineae bacterium]|nr:baseplate assembly protein [Anaerolineae bacterium]MCB0228816.1 baseplate assembly protein [Anaerolineae bacterium]MCB0240453.1 baseplate assembly protein [Anaerolineae bacterium]MCB0248821.1 baseplate assembly protein [Anaerolineae bacterium]MCO5245696.1 phage baseplate assembly protein V [Anaerolineae bacterium]